MTSFFDDDAKGAHIFLPPILMTVTEKYLYFTIMCFPLFCTLTPSLHCYVRPFQQVCMTLFCAWSLTVFPECPKSTPENGIAYAAKNVYFMSAGLPTLSSSLLFANRTITCISSGGPATTVLWSRYYRLPPNTQEQHLIDTETATYHSLFTITGSNIRDFSGRFSCRVSNSRGASSQSLYIDSEQNLFFVWHFWLFAV